MELVGIIFGDVGTNEFNCMLQTITQRTEYVQMQHELCGWVLGQVDDVERRTDFSAEKAQLVSSGENIEINEKTIAKVSVIGYRDERNLLQVPHTPFKAGEYVYRAEEPFIKEVVGLEEDKRAGAYIGLLNHHNLRVNIDINSMVQKHVSILAKTGGGKSYLTGVLIEELIKHGVTVLIIDPHGEYSSLREPGTIKGVDRDFGVVPKNYASHLVEFATDTKSNRYALPLKFTLSNLDARELLSLTNIKNIRAYYPPLKKVLEHLKRTKGNYTIKDIIHGLELEKETIGPALITDLEYLKDIDIFADRGTRMDEIVRKGRTTIINLKGTPPDIRDLVVNRIATALFELRKIDKVPPMMFVVEEAHNFCPQQEQSPTSKIFRTIASEGRKFGLGLCIITQRAAKVDKNVLSQCNTQIILKVTNPNDLKAITSSVEGLTKGMEEEIQRLPTGVAIVTGGNISMPLFVEVRPRETKHGGESVNVI